MSTNSLQKKQPETLKNCRNLQCQKPESPRDRKKEKEIQGMLLLYLIWLRNISKNYIYHTNKHPVFHRMTSILNDRNHVSPLLSHIHKVPATAMGEFNCIHYSCLLNIQKHAMLQKTFKELSVENFSVGMVQTSS